MRKSLLSIICLCLNLALFLDILAEEITILGLTASDLLSTNSSKVSLEPKPGSITVLKISANGTIAAKPGSTSHSDNDYIPTASQESLSTPESLVLDKPSKLTKLNLRPLVGFETLEDGKIKLRSPHSLISSITFRPSKKVETMANRFLSWGESELPKDSAQYICLAGFSKITIKLNLDALAKLVATYSTSAEPNSEPAPD